MTLWHVPGMLAVAYGRGAAPPMDLRALLAGDGLTDVSLVHLNGVVLATWGLGADQPTADRPLMLPGTNWGEGGSVAPAELARWLADSDLDRLGRMLPPFGAVGLAAGGVRVSADQMGFRQVFCVQGTGWTAVSSSARLLSVIAGGGLDEDGVLLQSQLGWQLGLGTLFRGVTKLPAGESVLLANGEARGESAPETGPAPGTIALDEGVRQAAALLRGFLEEFLDEVPGATLQLTGGQDSRILLSAIPPARRRGLKVMTLDVPGTGDAQIAAELAAKYGMVHTTHPIEGVAGVSPAEWFELVCGAASRHECMVDPIAKAVAAWAERSFEQGYRLSGLGGEIARGFYYTGWVRPRPVTRRRTETLARWRMLANEPAQAEALSPGYRERAIPRSLDLAGAAIGEGGAEWYTATDELYYRHRMQRWAGLSESSVSAHRTLINPMLDHRFRAIARGLAPRDKQNARFLARLQVDLDEELASIPLDNRPAPQVYAAAGPLNLARQQASKAVRLARKVRQRLEGSHRPPPGGAVVASKLAEYFRQQPVALDPVRGLGVFDQAWLDGIVNGSVRPAPSSLALLMNLLVAVGHPTTTAGGR